MGIQVNTFGNHDFDRGIDHLQSMIDLAARRPSADHPGKPFPYVAANLKNLDANLTGVDPFKTINIAKLKVAFIGIVNEEAPTIVSPGNFGTIEITDGVAAATTAAQKARQTGANVVVVITHKGMDTVSPATGKLKDFAEALPGGPRGRRARRPHEHPVLRDGAERRPVPRERRATGTRTRRR